MGVLGTFGKRTKNIANEMLGGLHQSVDDILSVGEAAVTKGGSPGAVFNSRFLNETGDLRIGRAAGAAMVGYTGLSTAGRIVTGGGLYKDAEGNTDIIGIPFI